jgi:hypothetical protein
MLPMLTTLEEVANLCEMVAGRAGIIPLLETPGSIKIARGLTHVDGIHELYVGLNDLHLALGMQFIFEPLATGLVDQVADIAKSANLRFGFGGVARAGEGMIPGEMVLSEHVRLGSDAVILSRTFYRPDHVTDTEDTAYLFLTELNKLKRAEQLLLEREAGQIQRDHQSFLNAVERVKKESSS